MEKPAAHPYAARTRTGVLLINLGTPDGTGYFAVRRYLKTFLSDRRVVEINPLLWKAILHLFVLPFRPFASGRLYEKIWDRERNESPLLTHTRAQCAKLRERLAADDIPCAFAMRYGAPGIGSGIDALVENGCRKILILPLYPQYCAATVASAYDAVFAHLMRMRYPPEIETVEGWHDSPPYIAALARSLRKYMERLDAPPDRIVCSFHGMPRKSLEAGDPYHCFCAKTSRLLREALGWPETRWHLAFQSKFGRAAWLDPSTRGVVLDLAKKEGQNRILLIAPGFVSDCLETLEELDHSLRAEFLDAGGAAFGRVPCLNDSDEGIGVLEHIVRARLAKAG